MANKRKTKFTNLSSTTPYVLENERGLDPEDQTVFHLVGLPARLQAHLDDQNSRLEGGETDDGRRTFAANMQPNATAIAYVRFGVSRIDNFQTEDPTTGTMIDIPQTRELQNVGNMSCMGLPDTAIDAMPLDVIREVWGAIKRGNTMEAQEAGNSEGLSSQSPQMTTSDATPAPDLRKSHEDVPVPQG